MLQGRMVEDLCIPCRVEVVVLGIEEEPSTVNLGSGILARGHERLRMRQLIGRWRLSGELHRRLL